ncbi:MAG TPA: hypothetical protein VK892_06370 [Pyrinomonadaceae bacterium]|nr:hypothetical protein [Pyrinomonadaceae bacterium]
MNIKNRIQKLETQNGNSLSEFCSCGHKNKVKMKSVNSDAQTGTINFAVLPCERCGKAVLSDLPETFTFTINSTVKLNEI